MFTLESNSEGFFSVLIVDEIESEEEKNIESKIELKLL